MYTSFQASLGVALFNRASSTVQVVRTNEVVSLGGGTPVPVVFADGMPDFTNIQPCGGEISVEFVIVSADTNYVRLRPNPSDYKSAALVLAHFIMRRHQTMGGGDIELRVGSIRAAPGLETMGLLPGSKIHMSTRWLGWTALCLQALGSNVLADEQDVAECRKCSDIIMTNVPKAENDNPSDEEINSPNATLFCTRAFRHCCSPDDNNIKQQLHKLTTANCLPKSILPVMSIACSNAMFALSQSIKDRPEKYVSSTVARLQQFIVIPTIGDKEKQDSFKAWQQTR